MSQLVRYDTRSQNPCASSGVWRSVAQRVIGMLILWLALGALVGVLSAPPNGGVIGFLAGAVAGMMVLPVVGVILGLLGGRWRESLLGATCGLASGASVALVAGNIAMGLSASLCLILGGCAGGTFPQLFRLNVWLAGRVSAQVPSAGRRRAGRAGVCVASPDGAISP
jgi:hypothetical protein